MNLVKISINLTDKLDLLCQLIACMPMYKTYVLLHFTLQYLHMNIKNNHWYTLCPSKCIWILFAKNLNDLSIHLFGANCIVLCQFVFKRTIRFFAWQRTSPISYSVSLSLHSWYFLVTPEKSKLTLVQQNESFDSKLFQEKHFKLLCRRLTVDSFYVFVRGSPIFT